MRRVLLWIFLLLFTTKYLFGIIYEDAELGDTSKWLITDTNPSGATVENIFDSTIQSKVIVFSGQNYENQYRIGDTVGGALAWEDSSNFYLSWNMKSSEGFFIDVILETTNGLRYIRYSDDIDHGIDEEYIHQGLGYNASNGNWHNFVRDLNADLKELEANNTIISVNGLEIRGSISIDNIQLLDKPTVDDFKIYEDAEDNSTSKWIISDNIPAGATISNVFDNTKGSQVIKLENLDSYENQYQLGSIGWNNTQNFNIKWDMLTTEGYIVDIKLNTLNGERYLRYTDNNESFKGIEDGDTIYYGIGSFTTNGTWHTITRDLKKDFIAFQPNNQILSVDSFLIRANAKIDNVELFSSLKKIYEDAEDSKIDRWRNYLGPNGATINNIYDSSRESRVISLQGAGYSNQYIIGGDTYDNNGWKDKRHKNIKWSMKNSDGCIIYVNVLTENGARFLKYSDNNFSQNGINGDEIYYGLGVNVSNDKWHTFIRDIDKDIKQFEPNNKLTSIEGFQVIGNAKIDDLELFSILHPVDNQAGLTLTFDDYDADGWYSLREILSDYNSKATFFLSNVDRLTSAQIIKLHTLEQDGHEIGGHTYEHLGVESDFQNEIDRIQEYIETQITPLVNWMNTNNFNPQSLAYPYGEHERHYDNAVRAYFPYLRTTASDPTRKLYQLDEIYHKKGKTYNILAGEGIDNSYNQSVEDIRKAFIKAREHGEIITLYGHQILDEQNNPYAVSAQKIEKILEIAKEVGLKSYTFKESYLIGN